jgi:hypothetical protein
MVIAPPARNGGGRHATHQLLLTHINQSALLLLQQRLRLHEGNPVRPPVRPYQSCVAHDAHGLHRQQVGRIDGPLRLPSHTSKIIALRQVRGIIAIIIITTNTTATTCDTGIPVVGSVGAKLSVAGAWAFTRISCPGHFGRFSRFSRHFGCLGLRLLPHKIGRFCA